MITGIHHISMKCGTAEEYRKAKEFYVDVLGFTVRREWPEGMMIDTGSGLLEIGNDRAGIRNIGAIRHIAFATDNTDEIIGKVKANRRISCSGRNRSIPRGLRSATVPWGNRWSFSRNGNRTAEKKQAGSAAALPALCFGVTGSSAVPGTGRLRPHRCFP